MSNYECAIDEAFDNGEDVLQYFDISKARLQDPVVPTKKININIPQWLIDELDKQASSLAISRNAIINVWLAERVKQDSLTHT